MEFISFTTSISVLIFSLTTKLLCTNMSKIAVMALSPSLPVSLSSLSSTDQSVCQWIWYRAENGEAAGGSRSEWSAGNPGAKADGKFLRSEGQQERLGSINKVQDRSIGSVTQREQRVSMAAPQGLFIIRLTGTKNISARENCTAYNPLTSHCLSQCCFEHLCLVFGALFDVRLTCLCGPLRMWALAPSHAVLMASRDGVPSRSVIKSS